MKSDKDFIPLYDHSDQCYKKPEGFSFCGCLGPVHGEPFCPCQMAQEELPLSKEHVAANEKSEKEWQEFINDNEFWNDIQT